MYCRKSRTKPGVTDNHFDAYTWFNVNFPEWDLADQLDQTPMNRVEACRHDRLESAPFRSQLDSNLTSVRAFWRYGRGGGFGCSFWKLRKCRSASAALPRLR